MTGYLGLTTARVLSVFSEEMAAHDGRVIDTYDDGQRLFTRAVLPREKALRPGDAVQGGVALRATEQDVLLSPFVLRLVCRNGAIFTQLLGTWHLDELHLRQADEAERSLCEAIAMCCDEEVLQKPLHHMRLAGGEAADARGHLVSLADQLSSHGANAAINAIMRRFSQAGDPSRLGLVNAATSLARDTRDPELRWSLEELGGAIAVDQGLDPRLDPRRSVEAKHGKRITVG